MWLPVSPHIGSIHVFRQGLAERDSYRVGVKYGHKYPAPHMSSLWIRIRPCMQQPSLAKSPLPREGRLEGVYDVS